MANTGRIRYKEKDLNPNSPTFGQERWGAYENNTSACPLAKTYVSRAFSGYTSKNNCPSGMGSPVYYTVPYGYSTSIVSQEEADASAQAYYENSRQAYANLNGTCESGTLPTVKIIEFGQFTPTSVQATALRSDSGAVLVVQFRVLLESGTKFNGSITIPAGQFSAEGAASYSSDISNEVIQRVDILSTTPTGYQILPTETGL